MENKIQYGYKCSNEQCQYYAIYGGTIYPLYCEFHCEEPKFFKDYKSKKCIHTDCKKSSSFNFIDGQRPIFCLDHKQPSMINTNTKKCVECKIKTAKFNYKNQYPKPLYCKDCKNLKSNKQDIVDCYETLCSFENCWKQATFGYDRNNKKEWTCKLHMKDNMKDVKNVFRKCEFKDCEHQANYNYANEKRAIYCKKHKEEGMIDKYHLKCDFEGCNKRPCYNLESEPQPKFCKTHKSEEMIDVITKRCIEIGCNKFPMYNYNNYQKPVYCTSHYKVGMVDVRRILCELCQTQASFGLLGQVVSRCASHKQNGMLRRPNRRCNFDNCNEYAYYGNIGFMAIFCNIHKHESHINLIEQECQKCNLPNILNSDYLCVYCEVSTDKIIMKKQNAVKEWLDKHNYKYIIYDKPIDNGFCNRHRPDFLFESYNGVFSIILEVDENCHSSYNFDCERTRMISLSQAVGQPTIFIRYNPDKYLYKGQIIKNHIPSNRLKVLNHVLDRFLNVSFEEIQNIGFCSFITLFYDEFDESKLNDIQTLLKFDNEK